MTKQEEAVRDELSRWMHSISNGTPQGGLEQLLREIVFSRLSWAEIRERFLYLRPELTPERAPQFYY